MIILFTDFSYQGPFVGQMKSAIYQENPQSKIIDLMHDAPMFDLKHSACLLSSLVQYFPEDSVFCCVVDPGVGSSRQQIVVKADTKYFIGPDNGLFEYICRLYSNVEYYHITLKPERLSTTFHGRDIFAPIAAQIDGSCFKALAEISASEIVRFHWPDDLYEIIYIDHFGNLMTGIRSTSISTEALLEFREEKIQHASTYSLIPDGKLGWYINSNQLVEIALKQNSAAIRYKAQIGDVVISIPPVY